jgi:hypothetical protein
VIFDPSNKTPSTVLNADGSWTTTVNPFVRGDIFFVGQALPLDANMQNAGNANSTLSFSTNSSDSTLQFEWQWSATVYASWPGNAAANIQPIQGQLSAGAPQDPWTQGHWFNNGGNQNGNWWNYGNMFTGAWSSKSQNSCHW